MRMCKTMCIEMCRDTYAGMCIDMCIHICIDMCTYIHVYRSEDENVVAAVCMVVDEKLVAEFMVMCADV